MTTGTTQTPNPVPSTPAQRAWTQALRQAIAAHGSGRWIEAETAGRKAVELARGLPMPEGGADLAASLNLLGNVLQGLGRAQDAASCYAEALDQADEVRARVVALANLGSARREAGEFVVAEEHLVEGLALARDEVPDQVEGLLDKLGRLFQQTERAEEALRFFVERVERTAPPDGAEGDLAKPTDAHLDALFHLAAAALEHGDAVQAANWFRDLSDKMTVRGGARSLGRAQALTGLARAHQLAGRHAEAVASAREALEVREAMLGRDHPELLSARHNLAHVLLAAGKAREAEPLARAVMDAVAGLPADDGRRTAALEVLVGVLEKTGRLREAATFKKQLSKS